MKNIKRLASIILALLMLMCMATTAFAAQTGSLTINGTVEGKQYDIYRVFDLTQAGDNYSYSVNNNFAPYFTAASIDDPIAYVGAMTNNSEELATLAKNLLGWAITNDVAPVRTVTGTDGTTTITDLDYGYYLLNPLGGSIAADGFATMFALNTLSGNDTTITVKAEYPTITKTVESGQSINEASIGDTLQFKLESTVPDMTGYNRYHFVINDALSAGLTFKNITSVMIGATVLTTDDYTITVTTDGVTGTTSLRIVFKDFINYSDKTGDQITVVYDAELNENAVIGGVNKNEATLEYSNDPKYDYTGDDPQDDPNAPTGETPKTETETYTTSLKINKKDGNGNILTGAAFRITGDGVNMVVTTGDVFVLSTEGTYWKLLDGTYTTVDPAGDGVDKTAYANLTDKYKRDTRTTIDTDGVTVFAEGFVDTNGELIFAGLGAGTYTITETVTPNGYNPISDITVNITFDPNTKQFATDSEAVTIINNQLSIDIVNVSGAVLPETGGIGTTIFYVVGGILVLGAAILLITKKRMSYEK